MSKRRLNRRQEWRIRKVQEERVARADRRRQRAEQEAGSDAALGPEQGGCVVANYGASVDIESEQGTVHRCHLRQNLDLPVVGDRIVWQAATDGTGVVVAVEPRRTLLARHDAGGLTKPLAANIDQILVVAAPLPPYSTDAIDQFLVAAEASGITPLILFNKADLLAADERRREEEELARYRDIGYAVIFASTRERHGLDDLTAALKGKTSIFAGQSGVGKSSLARALLPGAEIAVGELAELTGLGRHTTSSARLYHLPAGGDIIDSPGVREFRLWPMEPLELAGGFREFHDLLGTCRFRDCRHDGEPGCALAEGVETGAIHPQRLASYRRLAHRMAEQRTAFV